MKLLNCLACGDIVALQLSPRKCICGRSEGAYAEDHTAAMYSGPSRLLGIDNGDLILRNMDCFVIADGDGIMEVDPGRVKIGCLPPIEQIKAIASRVRKYYNQLDQTKHILNVHKQVVSHEEVD